MSGTTTDARLSLLKLFPSVSEPTIKELERRRMLHLAENQWRLGDNNNGSTRRLDAKKWLRADNSGSDWHKLIGLDDVVLHDRRYVIFVIEGSKDALADSGASASFGDSVRNRHRLRARQRI